MKLTKPQIDLIQQVKKLEEEYGQGNIFIRYVTPLWHHCFVVHKKGDDVFRPLCKIKQPHGRVIHSLEAKGLATGCDYMHEDDADPNDWRHKPAGWCYIGIRIKTENF